MNTTITKSRAETYKLPFHLCDIVSENNGLIKKYFEGRDKNDVFFHFLGALSTVATVNFIRINHSYFFDLFDTGDTGYETINVAISEGKKIDNNCVNSVAESLIFGPYHIFEDFISTVFDALHSEEEKEEIRCGDFKEELRKSSIEEGLIDKLTKKCLGNSDFIPINRKINGLIDKLSIDKKTSKEIREFMKFYGAIRNSVHNNTIYRGHNFPYHFDRVDYNFVDGEAITIPGPHLLSIMRKCRDYFLMFSLAILEQYPGIKIDNVYQKTLNPGV